MVIGSGGPGVETDDTAAAAAALEDTADAAGGAGRLVVKEPTTAVGGRSTTTTTTTGVSSEAAKTLADARFVVGDFLSVAILPPSSVDGSVVPASAARMGRGYGVGQASLGGSGGGGGGGAPPHFPVVGRDRGYGGYGYGRGGLGSRMSGGGGGGYGREGGGAVLPVGEWRRGERLPDGPPQPSGRGRGGGRRRW